MTQIVTYEEKFKNVRGWLDKSKGQIAMALPRHITPEKMMRVALTSVQRTPKLLDCTPKSLMGAIIQSSILGLFPDGITGEAYLVPFKDQVQLIPGYRGLMQLARRSSEVVGFDVHAVYPGDKFDYSYGLRPELVHKPDETAPDHSETALTHVYAVAMLRNGHCQFRVLTKAQVEKIRRSSRASENGPWVTNYEWMAMKSVIKQLCKLLPSNTELQTAIGLDDAAERDVPQNLEGLVEVEEVKVEREPGEET